MDNFNKKYRKFNKRAEEFVGSGHPDGILHK